MSRLHASPRVLQVKARRQQLQLKDGVLEQLEDFISCTLSSLPQDLQHVLESH